MQNLKGMFVIITAMALLGSGCDTGGGDDGNGGVGEDTILAEDSVMGLDTAPPPEDTLPAGDTAPPPEDTLPAEDTAPPSEDTEKPADEFVIPLAELSGTAKFYSWKAPAATVKFFAVLDAAGGVHVAFDACDLCYGAKLGYSQEGDMMVCNNCGNKFLITGIGTTNRGGGCWPGYLPVTIGEDAVTIQHADLKAGSWYFQ